MTIQSVGELVDDEVGHVDVDFAGEFNEPCAKIKLPCFPREIERINGNAVASEPGARIEGLKAEGLGLGRVDDFVDVDSHAHTKLLEFIDQGNVDAAVDVFKQLGHLRN